MTTTQPVGQRIPTPPEFPVQWDDPNEEHLFWTRERMHYPEPVKAVIESLDPEAGLNFAAEAYGLPIRYFAKVINTYRFTAVAPVTTNPEELAVLGEQAQENVRPVLARLGEVWETEMLPEVREHLAYWDSFDLRGATMPELLVHFDETVRRFKRLWEIHFMIGLPMLLSMSLFDDFYRDLFGSESAFDAFRLLQGFDNKTLEGDRALWHLSRKALAVPAVRTILEEQATADVVPALEQSPEGRAFLSELRAYLDEYGQRCASSGGNVFDPAEPSWIEDPTPVIKNLKDYITQPDRDLDAEMAKQATERERLLTETRDRLRGYPQQVVGQFEALLKAAQEGAVLSENHDFWIDFRGSYRIRRALLEIGRRLADAGVLETPNDVFHLKFDELRETMTALPAIDRRELVAQRKAEIAHFRTIAPPPALGTMLPGPPPDDPAGRTIMKFFGGPPQPSTEPGVLRGSPGSPGTVRGTAKVVRSLAEAAKLEPGDIMVAETTAPPWTPLFATVAAVVTDTGGILSHCAIVAREYGIPAVVGTGMATAIIQDGQTVEVEGDTGIVRVITPA